MGNDVIYILVAPNPKHEIRNTKQSQMAQFQMSQTREFWKFEFVSDFDIRISDF
jgi:hypothetical protein